MGTPKERIADELGISKNTVTSIIELNDFDREIEEGRVACVQLIPKGTQAIEKAFDRGDGALAMRMFEGLGILGERARSSGASPDINLQVAVNNLLPAQVTESKAVIETKADASVES